MPHAGPQLLTCNRYSEVELPLYDDTRAGSEVARCLSPTLSGQIIPVAIRVRPQFVDRNSSLARKSLLHLIRFGADLTLTLDSMPADGFTILILTWPVQLQASTHHKY